MTPARIGKESVPMWQKIQTYVFVTIITVLIWLYAEGSTLQKRSLQRQIQFVAPTGLELFIDPRRPQETVELTVRGPVGQLDELERRLGERRIEIEVAVDSDSDDPQQKVNLHGHLSAYLAGAAPGVALIDLTPTELSIRAERYATRKLPILPVADGDVQVEYTGIDPAEAEVKMPASLLSRLDDDAKVEALMTEAEIAQSEMDKERTAPVRLKAPLAEENGVTVDPQTANVTFKITQTTESYTVPHIPLRFSKPASAEGQYEVYLVGGEEKEAVRVIEVTGPTEIIDQIKDEVLTVKAVLDLNLVDLGEAVDAEMTCSVTFYPPEGVTVVTPPPARKYRAKLITEAPTQ